MNAKGTRKMSTEPMTGQSRDIAAIARRQTRTAVEDALRASWAKYETTKDWYDAAGISEMADAVMSALDSVRDNAI